MGGAIAQQLALSHPKKINKLILYATAANFDPRCLNILQQQAVLWEQRATNKEIYELIELPWCYSKSFFTDPENVANTLKMMLANPYPISLKAYQNQFQACQQHDTRDLIEHIEHHTLILSLEEDILTSPCDGQYMASRIANACFLEMKGYAHGFHYEDPESFIKQIHLYLQRQKV